MVLRPATTTEVTDGITTIFFHKDGLFENLKGQNPRLFDPLELRKLLEKYGLRSEHLKPFPHATASSLSDPVLGSFADRSRMAEYEEFLAAFLRKRNVRALTATATKGKIKKSGKVVIFFEVDQPQFVAELRSESSDAYQNERFPGEGGLWSVVAELPDERPEDLVFEVPAESIVFDSLTLLYYRDRQILPQDVEEYRVVPFDHPTLTPRKPR